MLNRADSERGLQTRRVTILLTVGVLSMSLLLALALYDPQPIAGLLIYPPPQRGHVTHSHTPAAGPLPPVGGLHDPVWQNCGVYTESIDPAHAVHTLEHGAVWITVRPDLPPEMLAPLQTLVQREPFLLLSPFPTQEAPIVLTAWGVQLALDDVADSRLRQFINRYRLGPTVPERGASCEGGAGVPLQ